MNARELGLGEDLRKLRLGRSLSLGEASLRADLSKSGLMGWESGRTVPRGSGLARLLDALEAGPRLRARLLHAADPQFARIALADTALGAPVDLGAVIRAMRGRRDLTQADLARAAGVTQATVARWESGDAVPSGENLHAAAFALGARPEEAIALVSARGEASGDLHDGLLDNPEAMHRCLEPRGTSGPLWEVTSLGLEAELWHCAARDARWDATLAGVVGRRAVLYFLDGRLGEAEETARRVLRLAQTPSVRFAATTAFSALLEVATHQGANPAVLAEKIETWTARLPVDAVGNDRGIKPWMRWERALRLGEMGRPDDGLALIQPDQEAAMAHAAPRGSTTVVATSAENARMRMEIELRAGRGDRAEDLLPAYEAEAYPDRARRRVRVAHAQGRVADETAMEAMREEPCGDHDHWYTRSKIAKIERQQARLARAS